MKTEKKYVILSFLNYRHCWRRYRRKHRKNNCWWFWTHCWAHYGLRCIIISVMICNKFILFSYWTFLIVFSFLSNTWLPGFFLHKYRKQFEFLVPLRFLFYVLIWNFYFIFHLYVLYDHSFIFLLHEIWKCFEIFSLSFKYTYCMISKSRPVTFISTVLIIGTLE